jgi:hypothetical protein
VHFADVRTGWAVGDGGTILATRDGGASWEPQHSGTGQDLWGVHFADARTGWAIGKFGTMLRAAHYFMSPSIKDPTAPTMTDGEVDISFAMVRDRVAPIREVLIEARSGEARWSSIGLASPGSDARWRATWKPAAFHIEKGSPIEYRVLIDDGGPPLSPFSIGSFTFAPSPPAWRQLGSWLLERTGTQIAGGIGGAGALFWSLTVLILYWRAPARLLIWHERMPEPVALDEAAKVLEKITFGAFVVLSWIVRISLLFLGTSLRALDAWITDRVDDAQTLLAARVTVQDRQIALDLPVKINSIRYSEPWSELQRLMSRGSPMAMLISGPGGAGKTTLACRIGQRALGTVDRSPLGPYRMLPLLIEADAPEEAAKPDGLYPYLAGLLRPALNERRRITIGLISALLRSGRVLVIVDGLSERSEATRRAFDPQRQGFELYRFIVTSRERAMPGTNTLVEAETIPTGALFDFINRYLEEMEKNGEGTPPSEDRILDACGDLKRLLGDTPCTPLLASMWAREIGAPVDTGRPRGVASLMDSYVRRLLLPVTGGNEASVDRLTQDAAKIAELELGERYRPGYVTRAAALAVLRNLDPANPETRFEVLEKSRLLESPSQDANNVRIAPDPVAEHLVARLHTEELGSDVRGWRSFLDRVRAQGAHEQESPAGFVMALTACTDDEVYGRRIPGLIRQQIKGLSDNLTEDRSAA